jgi:hypothetical protein
MRSRRPLAAGVLLVSLLGCAHALPPKALPEPAVPLERAFLSNRKPARGEMFSATPIDGSYFSVSGASGSLLAGLAFGAIGAVGNKLYVDAANREHASVVAPLVGTNLAEVLGRSVPDLPRDRADASEGYELAAAAEIVFSTARSYRMICFLNAALGGVTDAPRWTSSYWRQVDADFDAGDPSDTDKAIASLDGCFREAYRLFGDHLAGRLEPFASRELTVREPNGSQFTIQLKVSQSALPDRIIGSDVNGVQEIPADRVILMR